MKICLFNWNNIMNDIAIELEIRGHEVELRGLNTKGWEKFDVLVFWNEIESIGWLKIIKAAQKMGKNTILLQHGRRGSSRVFPPFNEKVHCDKFCVWGEGDKERFMSCGIPEDKIVITGCPLFGVLKPRETHQGINVVFSPEHWSGDVPENLIVASKLKELEDVNIISKCLVGEPDIDMYDNVVISDRCKPGHFDIISDVLAEADVVVSISESTFELLAEYLDIPVVSFTHWIPKASGGDERYREYKRIYSDGCYQVSNIDNLTKVINRAIKFPEEMKKERKKAVIFDGGSNLDNPIERVCNEIVK